MLQYTYSHLLEMCEARLQRDLEQSASFSCRKYYRMPSSDVPVFC